MDEVGVRRLLAQDGVVARRQLLELDGQDHDIERMRLCRESVLDLSHQPAPAVLQRRGWTGSPRSCGPECALAA